MSNLKDRPDFATQSGHWYDRDGNPRYTVIGKNGKERNTNVTDAKTHGLVPSVTSILKLAAAPGLVNWQKEQVAKAAYKFPPRQEDDESAYLDRILAEAEKLSTEARDRGSEIHGILEVAYKTGEVRGYSEHVAQTMFEVHKHTGLRAADWSAERSFCSGLGFGGKIDLSHPNWVLDFKTTEKPLAGLKTWPDHRRQLAAYRTGLETPSARCAIVYVSAGEPGARFIELEEKELVKGWKEFQALFDLWCAEREWTP
jgi:hypothetical protein